MKLDHDSKPPRSRRAEPATWVTKPQSANRDPKASFTVPPLDLEAAFENERSRSPKRGAGRTVAMLAEALEEARTRALVAVVLRDDLSAQHAVASLKSIAAAKGIQLRRKFGGGRRFSVGDTKNCIELFSARDQRALRKRFAPIYLDHAVAGDY